MVPKTRVVKLASETFNYLRIDVEKSKAKKVVNEHFPKVGFLNLNLFSSTLTTGWEKVQQTGPAPQERFLPDVCVWVQGC